MAASVAVSTMTLGFTSHAADIQDSIIPAAAILSVEQILGDGLEEAADSKTAEVNEKPAETVEATLEKAEERAEELRAQKEAEEKRKAEEAAQQAQAARAVSVSGSGSKELLASIIFCEAGNQSFEGQVAVGAVVLNRIASSAYPNTMEAVIYQPGQFGPAGSGWLDQVRSTGGYTATSMQAAEAALAGQNPVGGCLYFDQGGYGMQIGAHFFH
ncbi:MAG: cell wall hydrolase [Dorea sp.]|nr:cell wall hydrolase [Dorea sp.]